MPCCDDEKGGQSMDDKNTANRTRDDPKVHMNENQTDS